MWGGKKGREREEWGEGGREGDEGEGREERGAALDAVGKERGRRSRV